jgi:hypothetical protein
VHDVHPSVLLDGQDKPLAVLDLEDARTFHLQPRHPLPPNDANLQDVTPGLLPQLRGASLGDLWHNDLRDKGRARRFAGVGSLPKIETMQQAREVLIEMSEGQEITAEQDEWQATIKKHDDAEFSAEFPEQETGTISLLDASQILLEHGNHDLYLSASQQFS